MPAKYPVIDYHTHLSPEHLDTILTVMDHNGIDKAVNLGWTHEEVELSAEASKEERSRAWLDIMSQALDAALETFPADRFALFTTPDFSQIDRPDFATFVAEELERSVEKGAKGLKIFKQLGLTVRDASGKLVSINDPRLDLLWEKPGELGVPVSIHIADPKALFTPPTPDNPEYEVLQIFPEWSFYGGDYPSWEEFLEEQRKLVKNHPDTTFVCVHFGNASEDLDYVGRLLDENPNVCIDTAARVGFLGAHPADQLREFFIKYQDRILFGTDFGVGNFPGSGRFWLGVGDGQEKTVEDCHAYYEAQWPFYESDAKDLPRPCPISGRPLLDGLHLPPEVLEKFYYKNARGLIPGWH
jgi:predicted TIM-barrel fold metal-dependent hydrolase